MKLEQITEKESYSHLERYVNQPKYSAFAQYSDAKAEFHPRLGSGSFLVPYQIRNDAKIITAFPDEKILSTIVNNGVRFFTHPQFFDGTADGYVTATPTASTRTVLVDDYFLKLHFPKRISRFNRRLQPGSVEHSVKISADLERSLANAPDSFAFLPESIGIIADGYGCIIREFNAHPKFENRFYIPFFSLYSDDPKNPDDKPLLIQMIERSNEAPLDFFIKNIAQPFISNWVWCIENRGLLLESHCQNTLLELDEHLQPTRIVYRDFQSMMVDTETRKLKNLDMPFTKHVIGGKDDPHPREQEYSIVYDHFVASYVFPYFSACLKKYCNIPEEVTAGRIKSVFQSLLPDQDKFFPNTVFTLADKLSDNNEVQLEDTHELPKYR